MSRLKELIDELCSEGVEYCSFDDVCTLKARIGWQRLTKSEYLEAGECMLITGTDFTENHKIDYETCVYVSEERYAQDPNIQLRNGDVLITKDGTLGKVAIVENLPKRATLNGGVFVVRCKSNRLLQRYVMHYLTSNRFLDAVENQHTGSTIKHLTQAIFSRLKIPVPPIEVQREIVRILDSMQQFDDALSEELVARSVQMAEVIRNIIAISSVSEFIELGDACAIKTGTKPAALIERTSSAYPYVNAGLEPSGWVEQKNADGCCVTIPSRGVGGAGKVGFQDRDFWGGPLCYQIRSKSEDFDTRFIYYYLLSIEDDLMKLRKTGGMAAVNKSDLAEVPVPNVSLKTQRAIVDKVDMLRLLLKSEDSSIGAELQLRRKQFEHYRDLLLDFPEKVA